MTFIKYIPLIFFLLLFFSKANAQKFVIDTTDNRVAYYRSLNKQNENIIHFMQYTLAQQGIPKSLSNLAIIESGLQNKSLSPAMAAGTWQLIPDAASFLGIEVTDKNDERYDLY